MKDTYILWGLVLFAFLLRIGGVTYGLPLTLIDDEPPFTLAALQMLELKTLIPALHPEAFQEILYYPLYLSYLLLIPFTVIVGTALLLWQGSTALFTSFLLSDLSAFFITARLIHVGLGVLSVYLIYRVSESLFHSRVAAFTSAFFLATSLLHIALSMVGRHWLPASFIFLLVLYVLTREYLPENRRYAYSLLLVGTGLGISMITPLALIFPALWFALRGTMRVSDLFRDRFVVDGALGALVLGILPYILHQNSTGVVVDLTLFMGSKSLIDLFMSPLTALSLTAWSEPVLTIFFLVGLFIAFWKQRFVAIVAASFFALYIAALYLFFRFEPRFMLPLIPLYALLGGCVFHSVSRRRILFVCALILLIVPLVGAVKLFSLALKNDTRVQAREWVLQHLPEGEKILVYAQLTRLPTTAAAVEELRDIDKGAVRRSDEADGVIEKTGDLHALTLYAVHNEEFFANLPTYAQRERYHYLLLEPEYAAITSQRAVSFETLEHSGKEIMRWEGLGDDLSLSRSQFTAPLTELFGEKSLGPTIVLYQLAD